MKKIGIFLASALFLVSCNTTQTAKTTEECKNLMPHPYEGYAYTFDANAEPKDMLFVISAGPIYSEANGGCVYQITQKSNASDAKEGDKQYALYKMMTKTDQFIASSDKPFDSLFQN